MYNISFQTFYMCGTFCGYLTLGLFNKGFYRVNLGSNHLKHKTSPCIIRAIWEIPVIIWVQAIFFVQ